MCCEFYKVEDVSNKSVVSFVMVRYSVLRECCNARVLHVSW